MGNKISDEKDTLSKEEKKRDHLKEIFSDLKNRKILSYVFVGIILFNGGLALIVDNWERIEYIRYKIYPPYYTDEGLIKESRELASEINEYVYNRKINEPNYNLFDNEEYELYKKYHDETMMRYKTQFSGEISKLVEEYHKRDIDVELLEGTNDHPTNPLGIEMVANELNRNAAILEASLTE